MTPHPSMPEWPEKPLLCVVGNQWTAIEVMAVHNYERARADAWEARCRLAVEALKALRSASIEETLDEIADKALDAIGPLP